MCVSLVAAMMPNKTIISQNFPGTNLTPRETWVSPPPSRCGGGSPSSLQRTGGAGEPCSSWWGGGAPDCVLT